MPRRVHTLARTVRPAHYMVEPTSISSRGNFTRTTLLWCLAGEPGTFPGWRSLRWKPKMW